MRYIRQRDSSFDHFRTHQSTSGRKIKEKPSNNFIWDISNSWLYTAYHLEIYSMSPYMKHFSPKSMMSTKPPKKQETSSSPRRSNDSDRTVIFKSNTTSSGAASVFSVSSKATTLKDTTSRSKEDARRDEAFRKRMKLHREATLTYMAMKWTGLWLLEGYWNIERDGLVRIRIMRYSASTSDTTLTRLQKATPTWIKKRPILDSQWIRLTHSNMSLWVCVGESPSLEFPA